MPRSTKRDIATSNNQDLDNSAGRVARLERSRNAPVASSTTRPPPPWQIFNPGISQRSAAVWDAPRPEFWPTLTWDRTRRQIGAELDEEVLAALPGILREAEGTPEYPQLWWVWSTLSSAAAGVGGLA